MRTLYPEIEPFDIGTLKVDDRHTLYYEQCGNPNGKPVVMLHGGPGESTADIRARCNAARAIGLARQGKTNHVLQGRELDTHLHLDDAAAKFLNVAAARLGWSARGTHRVLKVARTVADLAGSETTQVSHLAEAMQYRRSVP